MGWSPTAPGAWAAGDGVVTIERGRSWGQAVPRPDTVVVASSDAELAGLLDDPAAQVALRGGDMFTTLGARPPDGRTEFQRLPVDLVDVRLDGAAHRAVSHVVVRSPRWLGGSARGELIVVMNAEYLGGLDVAPRGHPNDGKVEVFTISSELGLRQRLAVRRRARSASHLPHPSITTRSVRSARWEFDHPRVVVVDGVARGRAAVVEVDVVPDAHHLLT